MALFAMAYHECNNNKQLSHSPEGDRLGHQLILEAVKHKLPACAVPSEGNASVKPHYQVRVHTAVCVSVDKGARKL